MNEPTVAGIRADLVAALGGITGSAGDEALWQRARRAVEDVARNAWRNGKLLGNKAEEAYYVRCDRSTMTQDDIDNGRLVVVVGLATLKPAEFVVLRIVETVSAGISDVIARMQALLHPLHRADGVACFTRLYLTVTQGVQERLAQAAFQDPAFMSALDVRFAELFLTAATAKKAPGAWTPLFEARARRGISPLQFAFAGMNAHINRDLPIALVETCRDHGVALAEGSRQHADYLQVNKLLVAVESRVKSEYVTGVLHHLDRLVHRVHRLDDVVAMWNVARARDAAWTNAEALWAIRDDPALSARYVETLDRTVGLAGRGLLVPAETWLGRLARLRF